MIGEICNEVFFFLRRHRPTLRFSDYTERLETELKQSMIPAALASEMSERSLRQALFYAELLSRVPWPTRDPRAFRVIDLGSKDFVYAPALATVLADHFEKFELTGLELDPFQIYSNLYRRGDLASYYAAIAERHFGGRGQVSYQQGNWLTWKPPLGGGDRYDLITSFFPFLYSELHRRFGLPREGFSPRDYYQKCLRWSRFILFLHQGESERDDSIKLLSELGQNEILYEDTASQSQWMKRKHPVHILFVRSNRAN